MSDPERHKLIGGILCLDFVNSKNGHHQPVYNEYLHDYESLVKWCRHTGIFNTDIAAILIERHRQDSTLTQKAFKKAIRLREHLFDLFAAVTAQRPVPPNALKRIRAVHLDSMKNLVLIPTEGRFKWKWNCPDAPQRMLWPIAASTIQLLTSSELNRVKTCSGDHCDWFFLDASPNHQRRWCSMEDCGNKHKMKQRYRRKKQSGLKR